MKFQVNRSLVPIKAHFFFFFAALGPILPQLNVFGRQLGIPPDVMGMVTAVLPLLWAVAKPLFGYVVDFWPNHRKLIFMLLITTMTGSYCCLWFIPLPEHHIKDPAFLQSIFHLNKTVYVKQYDKNSIVDLLEKYSCHWSCTKDNSFDVYLSNNTYVNTLIVERTVDNTSCSVLHMEFNDLREGEVMCSPIRDCDLLCYEYDILEDIFRNKTKRDLDVETSSMNKIVLSNNVTANLSEVSSTDEYKSGSEPLTKNSSEIISTDEHKSGSEPLTKNSSEVTSTDEKKSELEPQTKKSSEVTSTDEHKTGSEPVLYTTGAFWSFVILMSLGTVAFNVANCIGDAVCFDVLGPEHGSRYGSQRAWGTAGYGITALAGGWLVELVSGGRTLAPAFILALGATVIDLFSCTALTLPPMTSPADSGAALRAVLKLPRVQIFIAFACIAGMFDSFIIYYMFWFLEEMAEETGHAGHVKLIEGAVVAGQSFFGEILFFALSGSIIKRLGFGTTFSLCLVCYAARMALISLVYNPWHLIFIESVMQGPTYALCYSTIVGYAADVAPAGYTATVQGVVAGADDGLGFALGSLLGGQLYRLLGGRGSFRAVAAAAAAAGAAHALIYVVLHRNSAKETSEEPAEVQTMLPISVGNSSAIYRDTVEPLNGKSKS